MIEKTRPTRNSQHVAKNPRGFDAHHCSFEGQLGGNNQRLQGQLLQVPVPRGRFGVFFWFGSDEKQRYFSDQN